MTRPWYGQSGFNSWQGQGYFLFVTVSRPAVGPTQAPIKWVLGALSAGAKQLGHEADHSPIPSTKIKKMWKYKATPPYIIMAWCLIKHRIHHGVVLN
jgi:hypothetical protein